MFANANSITALEEVFVGFPRMAAFLLWETLLLIVGLSLSILLRKNDKDANDGISCWLFGISISIFLSCAAGSVMSFLKLNYFFSYILFAVFIILITFAAFRLNHRSLKDILADFQRIFTPPEKRFPFSGFIVILLIVMASIAFARSMRPIDETDSLTNFNYILGWIDNKTTPYVFAYNYVAFWETGFMPSIILLGCLSGYWLHNIKLIIAIFLILILICEHLKINRSVGILIALNAICIRHFWVFPTGANSFKTDLPSAFALIFLFFAFVRLYVIGFDASAKMSIIFGAIFICVKYNGLLLLGLFMLLIILFKRSDIIKEKKALLVWSLAGIMLSLASIGHYYIRNIIKFKNVFYPIKTSVLGHTFPGSMDLTGTSIIDHVSDPIVWKLLFLPSTITGNSSVLGAIFPLTLFLSLLFSIILIIRGLIRLKKSYKTFLFPAAFFILLNWLLFAKTFWSAGTSPKDINYLVWDLNSLRYALGLIVISEVFIFYSLQAAFKENLWIVNKIKKVKTFFPFPLINYIFFGVLVFSLFTRLKILFQFSDVVFEIIAPVFIILLLSLSLPFVVMRFLSSRFARSCLLICLFFTLSLVIPYAYHFNRINNWTRSRWGDLGNQLYYSKPSTVLLFSGSWSDGYFNPKLPLVGRNFQNTVELIDINLFVKNETESINRFHKQYNSLLEKLESKDPPNYVAIMLRVNQYTFKSMPPILQNKLTELNYVCIFNEKGALLLKHVPSGASQ